MNRESSNLPSTLRQPNWRYWRPKPRDTIQEGFRIYKAGESIGYATFEEPVHGRISERDFLEKAIIVYYDEKEGMIKVNDPVGGFLGLDDGTRNPNLLNNGDRVMRTGDEVTSPGLISRALISQIAGGNIDVQMPDGSRCHIKNLEDGLGAELATLLPHLAPSYIVGTPIKLQRGNEQRPGLYLSLVDKPMDIMVAEEMYRIKFGNTLGLRGRGDYVLRKELMEHFPWVNGMVLNYGNENNFEEAGLVLEPISGGSKLYRPFIYILLNSVMNPQHKDFQRYLRENRGNTLVEYVKGNQEGIFIPLKTIWNVAERYGITNTVVYELILRTMNRVFKEKWGFAPPSLEDTLENEGFTVIGSPQTRAAYQESQQTTEQVAGTPAEPASVRVEEPKQLLGGKRVDITYDSAYKRILAGNPTETFEMFLAALNESGVNSLTELRSRFDNLTGDPTYFNLGGWRKSKKEETKGQLFRDLQKTYSG